METPRAVGRRPGAGVPFPGHEAPAPRRSERRHHARAVGGRSAPPGRNGLGKADGEERGPVHHGRAAAPAQPRRVRLTHRRRQYWGLAPRGGRRPEAVVLQDSQRQRSVRTGGAGARAQTTERGFGRPRPSRAMVAQLAQRPCAAVLLRGLVPGGQTLPQLADAARRLDGRAPPMLHASISARVLALSVRADRCRWLS